MLNPDLLKCLEHHIQFQRYLQEHVDIFNSVQ
jgi:hypothetical protein